MDFNDTPEEAAFRAEARAWLDANAELRDPEESFKGVLQETDHPNAIAWAKEWQKKKADAGWACITGLNTIFIDDRDPYAHGFQVV